MRTTTLIILIACVFFRCTSDSIAPATGECDKSDLAISLTSLEAASACTVADGDIFVTATGGKPPYQFKMETRISADGTFPGLLPGAYAVSVTDANNCQKILSNIIVSASDFSFQAAVVEDTDCTSGNGRISITPEEGVAPFEFRMGGGTFGPSGVFDQLASGTYFIEIRDNGGCASSLSIHVPEGNTGTSFTNDIRPLVETKCAQSGCHNGTSRPDLRVYSNAKFYADQMKELTANGSMPFEGSITQSQIDLIACWVDEGALNN